MEIGIEIQKEFDIGMNMKIHRETEKEEFEIKLSREDASRILDNVLAACKMPPCQVPFEVLEKRVQERGKV